MTFRIEVCSNSKIFADTVIYQIDAAATVAGVGFGMLKVVPHDHSRPGAAVALVVASDRDHADPADGCVSAALSAEQIVIAVIDDGSRWNDRLPNGLISLNAISMTGDDAGRRILEAAGVLTPLRGVFLSHRRSDGGAMALQLAGALRQRGLNTFVDVLDIPPNEYVQRRILSALDQMACMVLLESPDAIQSDWVMQEVVYSERRHLGVLSLCWADEDRAGRPPSRFAQFDAGTRIDVRPYLSGEEHSRTLSPEGVDLAAGSIVREFVSALYFRRLNLEREVKAAVPNAEQQGPWRFQLLGENRSRLIGLAPYLPDALDLYQLAAERDRLRLDDAVLVHTPIESETNEALMLAWIGDKGPELAFDTEQLHQLLI